MKNEDLKMNMMVHLIRNAFKNKQTLQLNLQRLCCPVGNTGEAAQETAPEMEHTGPF